MSLQMETSGDLKITGNGSAPGGFYKEVKITGEGIVGGDLECSMLKCTGTAQIAGNAKADTFTVTGSCSVKGNLDVRTLKVQGEADIAGSASIRQLACNGVTGVDGSLRGEDFHARGMLTVKESCEAESFVCKGSFRIGGMLNADRVEIRLHGESRAREIGGESISVERWGVLHLLKKWFGVTQPSFLFADMIEGDDIHLEYTKAKVVRGKRITLGPGCQIGLLEYSESFEPHPESDVNEHQQI